MSKRHILRPTLKAISLYVFLFIILVVTILPIALFFGIYQIWFFSRQWKGWKLWWHPKSEIKTKGIPKQFYTADFNEVKTTEMQTVQERRQYYDLPDATEKDLSGLCISGGGIRSATLGLGLMQTFISQDVMKDFDYMSTVSGGGYIGACLSSLMSIEDRAKRDFQKQKTLKEERKKLKKSLKDENLPQEIQSNIYRKIKQLDEKIAKLEWEIMQKENTPNLHELDLTPQNSPFTTDQSCDYQSFDKAQFNPKHQMHHLRTHGQYLTPDQGIGNRDVKRAFGAIWTGIMHNLFAYFTVIAIIISLAFMLLFAISNGEFFEAVNYDPVEIMEDESNLSFVMHEIENWYEKGISRQVKFITLAVRQHSWLCSTFVLLGLFFSTGFLFFAFWYQRPQTTNDLINEVNSGSTFSDEQEQKWLNFFRLASYVMLFIFPVVSVALMIQFGDHPFKNFYWIAFALPLFLGIGMITGTFMITPLMEYSKFVWNPILRNINDRFNRGAAGKRMIYQITRRRNSPSYRSLYSSAQGQAMYILILGLLFPFLLLAVFSLRLQGNFLFSLFSLGIVYYFFTSKFGSGNDIFNRLLEKVKLPLLNLSVFLMMFITMSVFAGWLIKWHGSISQNSEITIVNNAGEGLNYDTEPKIPGVLFRRQFDTLEFTIRKFDTTRYQINFYHNDDDNFAIIRDPKIIQHNQPFQVRIYPNKQYSRQKDYVSFNKFYHTDSLLVRIAVSENTDNLAYSLGGVPLSGFKIGEFKISTRALVILILCCIFLFIMGHLTNVNRLSLHYFYRDRLTETYLMTEGRVQRAEPLARQGMPLKLLRNHSDLFLQDVNITGKAPYHLIMAGLNLQGSNDLVRKVMKSEPFLFTKDYVGSASTGYVETEEYRGGTTTLSLAMTISGAAVSAGMGKLSFAAQAFFMSLFNLRTGFWIENPWYYRNSVAIEEVENKPWKIWKRPWWMRYLFYEMFGLTNAQTPFVNVSDGGFTGDNLGLLPLIQRQCKKIVICDFEEDIHFSFEAFTHACRIANIEYNTNLEINLIPLLPDEDKDPFRESKQSVIKGIIHYPNGEKGEILYIKSSIAPYRINADDLDDMPVNVFNYKKGNPNFPHESTADQFFNDVQFEAYRSLGNHLATQAVPYLLEWGK